MPAASPAAAKEKSNPVSPLAAGFPFAENSRLGFRLSAAPRIRKSSTLSSTSRWACSFYTYEMASVLSVATYYRDSTTGLDYAQNRYYANTLARFITPDPYNSGSGSGDPAHPQTWNRYAYVLGDPITFYDPSGEISRCPPGTHSGPDAHTCDPDHADPTLPPKNVPQIQQPGPDAPGPGRGKPTLSDCPQRPVAPGGVSVDDNIQMARIVQAEDAQNGSGIVGDLGWFYREVRNHGPWDYKQQGSQYQDFGNFNFGAVGAALGLDLITLERAAGWASIKANPSHPWPGDPGGSIASILLGLGTGPPHTGMILPTNS